MKNLKIFALGMALAAALPAMAIAANGYVTANLNLRAGPSTSYPPVTVIPAGAGVNIHGCLSYANWCDINFAGIRGWVSGSYLQALYNQRRVYVGPQYYRPLGIPMVTFSVGNYWDRYYRSRDFYRERDYWRDGYYRPPVRRDPPRVEKPRSWTPDNEYRRPPRDSGWDARPPRREPQRDARPPRRDADRNVRPQRENGNAGWQAPGRDRDGRPVVRRPPCDPRTQRCETR